MKFKNVARPAGARGFGTRVHLISIFPEYGQNTVRIEQRSQMIPEILMVKFYKVDIHSLTRGKKCLDVIIKKSVLIRGDVKIVEFLGGVSVFLVRTTQNYQTNTNLSLRRPLLLLLNGLYMYIGQTNILVACTILKIHVIKTRKCCGDTLPLHHGGTPYMEQYYYISVLVLLP